MRQRKVGSRKTRAGSRRYGETNPYPFSIAVCLFPFFVFPTGSKKRVMIRLPVVIALLLTVAAAEARADNNDGVDLFASGDLSAWWVGKKGTGWSVSADGVVQLDEPGAGWLRSRKKYKDFQLDFEWKISPGGNSGVIYRAHGRGLEYQILDDERHGRGREPIWSVGALYDLEPPVKDKPTLPAGEWNRSRIVVIGDHVEHWLNGKKIVNVQIAGSEWDKKFQRSKFSELDKDKFGRTPSPISFQDHGHPVWFRNVRIRELAPDG